MFRERIATARPEPVKGERAEEAIRNAAELLIRTLQGFWPK